ncbi:hypothetical protein HID58_035061 [Brassica napus]|uniref:Protein PHLOEM PROTEIN 2-LIKE A10 n=3 Tax=Brassica TaxID=3705 RepID=A0ABQ8C5K1_BRANA|nr:hypothetical protein HID58_035061 [Brassica napus]CDY30629.1 BnaAnng04040D [Brassica napus]
MDLALGKKGFDFGLRNKKWILLALSGYGAFRVYHSPSISQKRKQISKLLNLVEAATHSAEAVNIIPKDLTAFLGSDSNQIPNSLKQISKLAKSDELNSSLTRFTQTVTVGLLRGYRSDSVVALFSSREFSDSKLLDAVCSDDGRNLIGDCVQRFVSTAVSVYLDKTTEVNVFNDLFAGLTNPKHEHKVKQTLLTVCNGAVETFVRESADRSLFQTLTVGSKPAWFDRVSLAVPSNREYVVDLTGRVAFETVRSLLEVLVERANGKVESYVEKVRERGNETRRLVRVKSSLLHSLCLQIVEAPWILTPRN